MKISLCIFIIVAFAANGCAEKEQYHPDAGSIVIPEPVSFFRSNDSFLLNAKTVINTDDNAEVRSIGIRLRDILDSVTGFNNELKQNNNGDHSIRLSLNKVTDAE